MANTDVIVKDIEDDFNEDIENNKKIILLVEHSIDISKVEVFKRYIKRRFYKNISDYIIVVSRKEQIPSNRMKPGFVTNLLENDMKIEYESFASKYPKAKIDSVYAFHYCIDQSDNGDGEIMSIAIMRTKDGFYKLEFSPIIPITDKQYNALVNGDDNSEEGILLHNIITEKVIGDGLYGIIGYLTNGKFTSLDMYIQNLSDIIPIFKKMQTRRSKMLKYKKYKKNNENYMQSLNKETVTENMSDSELENVMI